jgi:hypothetical protein
MKTPESIKVSEPDYKPNAWEGYTLAELGWWVHLLTKRASMRATPEKRDKDLADAGAYLDMMLAHLEAAGQGRQNLPESAARGLDGGGGGG